jgi:hypothetical protein
MSLAKRFCFARGLDISGSTIPVFVIDQPARTRRASARHARLREVMAAFVRHARRSPSSISRL